MQETRISQFFSPLFLAHFGCYIASCMLQQKSKENQCSTFVSQSLAVQQSVDVAVTDSVSEGPLGVAGKDDCAVHWSSEEVSFV